MAGFLVEEMDFPRASEVSLLSNFKWLRSDEIWFMLQVFWGFYLLIATLNSLDLYYQVKKGYSNKRLREGYDSLE